MRPSRSPKWPKTSAPSGRATKPDGVGEERQQRAGERVRRRGRTGLLKTSAAAEPYRKKSYHSMVVPIETGGDDLLDGCGGHAVTLGSDRRHSYGFVTHTLAGPVWPSRCRRRASWISRARSGLLPAVAEELADPVQPLGDGVDVDVQGLGRAGGRAARAEVGGERGGQRGAPAGVVVDHRAERRPTKPRRRGRRRRAARRSPARSALAPSPARPSASSASAQRRASVVGARRPRAGPRTGPAAPAGGRWPQRGAQLGRHPSGEGPGAVAGQQQHHLVAAAGRPARARSVRLRRGPERGAAHAGRRAGPRPRRAASRSTPSRRARSRSAVEGRGREIRSSSSSPRTRPSASATSGGTAAAAR